MLAQYSVGLHAFSWNRVDCIFASGVKGPHFTGKTGTGGPIIKVMRIRDPPNPRENGDPLVKMGQGSPTMRSRSATFENYVVWVLSQEERSFCEGLAPRLIRTM